MKSSPYVRDILSQPEALHTALQGYPRMALRPLAKALAAGSYDRVLITGMGASLNAAYPTLLELSSLPVAVQWVETAELAHFARSQVTRKTLLWIVSQSGRSAEIIRLLENCREHPPATLIAVTNDPASPLAAAADALLPLNAGAEYTVSTRTYLNTLAVMALAGSQLLAQPLQPVIDAFSAAADAAAGYLEHLDEHLEIFTPLAASLRTFFLLGRGASLAAVYNGALVLKEAAKFPALGISAAQFRHGPFELVDGILTAAMFAGDPGARRLNLTLATDILRHGGRVFWIDSQPAPGLPMWWIPPSAAVARPVLESLPIQVLSIALAQVRSYVPGEFRHLGKVVLEE